MPLTLLNQVVVSNDGAGSETTNYDIRVRNTAPVINAEDTYLDLFEPSSLTGLILYNPSETEKIFVKIGDGAFTNVLYSFVLLPGAYWESPTPIYTGSSFRVMAEQNGVQLMITEMYKFVPGNS
ncbi:hypothetical protein [Nodularia sphaerocarpa]|uniref:hypothetical protein n=1 Tax=Nodularia sphaerocarpa TaxID=137816 RepID=UPI001EFB089A|nr:hypothetical protein [Nodularia sphaerocarpa]MDB9375757.1 hypothetical protein [Nodularia sphaerocarpa CS-585]MDB9379951.1 hypothetical protein [Nodularia sphaerocarpa CS-585A2]ULP73100.1 hypothetical protein BDGGKGIB_02753 [Nodularia sphaerocarpa UHCC 0038]